MWNAKQLKETTNAGPAENKPKNQAKDGLPIGPQSQTVGARAGSSEKQETRGSQVSNP